MTDLRGGDGEQPRLLRGVLGHRLCPGPDVGVLVRGTGGPCCYRDSRSSRRSQDGLPALDLHSSLSALPARVGSGVSPPLCSWLLVGA